MEIEKFDPTEAELRAIVEVTQHVTATDLEDKKQLAIVRENRIKLKNARVQIQKTGKALRDDALKFQRAVIEKEKSLIAIIEPEEDRLKAIEEEAAEMAERKQRVDLLPHRRERLAEIGDGIDATDDELLGMDGPAFEGYFNQRKAAKIEADRLALEARERELREAEEKVRRERELKEAEQRARIAERERLERVAKAEKERLEREEREAEERAKEEERRLQAETAFKAFLKDNGYNDETKGQFHISRTGTTVSLYRLVATYQQTLDI